MSTYYEQNMYDKFYVYKNHFDRYSWYYNFYKSYFSEIYLYINK